MAALTQDRNTPYRGATRQVADTIAARIYAGAMYTLDANGAAKPSVAADKKPVRAIATRHVETTDDHVPGERGVFRFNNSTSSAAVTRAEIGSNCFVADDNTVAKTGSSIVGEVVDIDDVGVWVHVGKAAVPTTA